MKEILIVGGAGYIGSHMCKYLAQNGYKPVVLDNLSLGHREAVKWGPLYVGNIDDAGLLDTIFAKHSIAAVMHFAAFCYVGESMTKPLQYYSNNVASTLGLLRSMLDHDVKRFIFSSTCATYGEPDSLPIIEQHEQRPINPYGRSKYMMEQIVDDCEQAYGLQSVCLRYFNAAGADPDGEIGEDHNPETHLIPIVLEAALGKRKEITIFGNDYPTDDGTCVRDYIHVTDLAQAHFLSLNHLLQGGGSKKYNLGNGNGCSVLDIVQTAEHVTGKKIAYTMSERRPGDPARLIGSSSKIISELGWQPRLHSIDDILQTAWNWHSEHPRGYESND